jgi:hypothetical protein
VLSHFKVNAYIFKYNEEKKSFGVNKISHQNGDTMPLTKEKVHGSQCWIFLASHWIFFSLYSHVKLIHSLPPRGHEFPLYVKGVQRNHDIFWPSGSWEYELLIYNVQVSASNTLIFYRCSTLGLTFTKNLYYVQRLFSLDQSMALEKKV